MQEYEFLPDRHASDPTNPLDSVHEHLDKVKFQQPRKPPEVYDIDEEHIPEPVEIGHETPIIATQIHT